MACEQVAGVDKSALTRATSAPLKIACGKGLSSKVLSVSTVEQNFAQNFKGFPKDLGECCTSPNS